MRVFNVFNVFMVYQKGGAKILLRG